MPRTACPGGRSQTGDGSYMLSESLSSSLLSSVVLMSKLDQVLSLSKYSSEVDSSRVSHIDCAMKASAAKVAGSSEALYVVQ